MYLQEIYLTNIACFQELRVDFCQPSNNQPCPWIVLLGENGTGKSTILQMLAVALLGRDMVRDVTRGVDWTSFVNGSKGHVEVSLVATSKEDRNRKHPQGGFRYRTAFDLGHTIQTGIKHARDIAPIDYDKLQETLYDTSKIEGGWFACGYGSWRTLQPRSYSLQALETAKGKSYRFATMFNADYQLTDLNTWLVGLDYQILKAQEDGTEDALAAKQIFDLAIHAFEKVLPGVTFKRITSEGEVIFNDNGSEVSIYKLSDGYRSTTAWIGDLIRRLVEAFPKMKNPLEAPGVVLIDEIDIHLHPRWQRTIVEEVRSLFPNLQFIVSTHSPFVAQDMRPEDKIVVLQKQDGQVTFQETMESIRGWRVDQILTSYLFNLETTT